MRLYGSFEKIEEKDDGTLVVDGYASSEAVDSQGEIVKAQAIADALPDYMKFGAVREMHQASAAGTAIEAAVGEDGRTYFSAHIVDPVACKKVQASVYKGFSIGGKVTKRDAANPKIITGIRLSEISLVDRPANPEATFSMYKAEGVDETEEIETPTVETPVKKSMYDVASLALALDSLASVTSNAAWEAKWEGDNSDLPAKLRAALTQLSPLLAVMAAEEGAELVASTVVAVAEPVEAIVEVIALADKTGDLAKKTAPKSQANKDKLQAIHDHAASMGADCTAAKSANTGDLSKVDLQKVESERDEALAKVATLETEKANLEKKVTTLEAQPEPPKGVIRAIAVEAGNAGTCWRIISRPPNTIVSRLLKSCATPPVSWPIASIF